MFSVGPCVQLNAVRSVAANTASPSPYDLSSPQPLGKLERLSPGCCSFKSLLFQNRIGGSCSPEREKPALALAPSSVRVGSTSVHTGQVYPACGPRSTVTRSGAQHDAVDSLKTRAYLGCADLSVKFLDDSPVSQCPVVGWTCLAADSPMTLCMKPFSSAHRLLCDAGGTGYHDPLHHPLLHLLPHLSAPALPPQAG